MVDALTAIHCGDRMVSFFSGILAANSIFGFMTGFTGNAQPEWIEPILQADYALFEWILLHLNADWLVSFAAFLCKNSTLAVVGLGLWLPYARNNPKAALYLLLFCAAAIGISDALASILKEHFGRFRPVTYYEIFYNPNTWSFPSAHSMNSMTLAMALLVNFQEKGRYFLILPLVIGACRVVSHYHFPGDVMGGWFFGAILGTALGVLWKQITQRWSLGR